MKKANKEEIKLAIEELSQSSLDKLLQFIQCLKEDKIERRPIKSFSLNGRFDSVDIRSQAYE